jgi:hypothetical protein
MDSAALAVAASDGAPASEQAVPAPDDSGGVGDSPAESQEDVEVDCLVCSQCSKVIALASQLITKPANILKSDVFVYDLDIFDSEYVRLP